MKEFIKAKALVRVFDEDKSRTLSFFEWFQATNMKNLTTPEEKLNWIFTAFDADGGGSLDVEEIREIIVWLLRFAGIEEDPSILDSCVIDFRFRVFQLLIKLPTIRKTNLKNKKCKTETPNIKPEILLMLIEMETYLRKSSLAMQWTTSLFITF